MSAQVHQAAVFANEPPVVRASNVQHCVGPPPGSYEAWIYPVHRDRLAFRAYVCDGIVCQSEQGCQEIWNGQGLQKSSGAPMVPPIRGIGKRIKHEKLPFGHGGPSSFTSHTEDLIGLIEALRPRQLDYLGRDPPATITEYTGPDPFEDPAASVIETGAVVMDSDESVSTLDPPSGNRTFSLSESDGGATLPIAISDIQYTDCKKTTLMIRNLPISATQQTLLKTWRADGTFDFLYMPFSFEKHRNLGYAFMNFVNHECALAFCNEWHERTPEWSNARKPLHISWAVVQGRENILMQLGKYKIARIKNIHYQPALFEGTQRVPLDYSLLSSGQSIKL